MTDFFKTVLKQMEYFVIMMVTREPEMREFGAVGEVGRRGAFAFRALHTGDASVTLNMRQDWVQEICVCSRVH